MNDYLSSVIVLLLLSCRVFVGGAAKTQSNALPITHDVLNSNRERAETVCDVFLKDWGIVLQNVEYQQPTDAVLCACATRSSSQANFLSCSVKLVQELWRDGILTRDETQAIRTSVAQSSNLWKKKKDSKKKKDTSSKIATKKDIGPSDFLQKESGITTLSSKATAAFDACKENQETSSFNSNCAKQLLIRLRKTGEIDKLQAKALKRAIDAFGEEENYDPEEQQLVVEVSTNSSTSGVMTSSSGVIEQLTNNNNKWKGLKGNRKVQSKPVHDDAGEELLAKSQRRSFLRVTTVK